jgi:hypothetical protein
MRYSGDWGRHLVSTTAARGVPIWNPEQWLDFTRDRSGLRISRPMSSGSSGQWRMDVPAGTDSRDLVLLVPEHFGEQSLAGLGQPPAGQSVELYGWRYRSVPLHGAPAALDLSYVDA